MHSECLSFPRPPPTLFLLSHRSPPSREAPPPRPRTVTGRVRPRPGLGCPQARELASGPLPSLRHRSSKPPPDSPVSSLAAQRPDLRPPLSSSTGVPASAPREPAPSLSSLVDPSGRWSEAPSRSQSDPLPVLSSAPECLGSAFNRPLVSRGL